MNSPSLDAKLSTDGELRPRILAAAIELFADRGYGRTSMREVAAAAGCTKPALYYHFGSKDDLFRAAIGQCMTGLKPLLDQVATLPGTVRDRIVAFARAMFKILRSDPAPIRLMLAMQTRPNHSQPDIDFARYHAQSQALLRTIFEEGVHSGEIRPDVDLQEAALALTAMLHSHAFIALKCVPTSDHVPERIVALLFDGIRTSTLP